MRRIPASHARRRTPSRSELNRGSSRWACESTSIGYSDLRREGKTFEIGQILHLKSDIRHPKLDGARFKPSNLRCRMSDLKCRICPISNSDIRHLKLDGLNRAPSN